MKRFCVNLTCAKNDPDKATVAFAMANVAAAADNETMVFLSVEAVRLSQKGYADDIREAAFPPLTELMIKFATAGGRILVCDHCFAKRKLDANNLVKGATIAGGSELVKFLSDGAPCISF
ncbi:MAG TPA: DsrE family protein [Thermoanaerobaculaceae bacterium]|nr:DsrE family protein [Thermoanaerobaculaceae bacterium]